MAVADFLSSAVGCAAWAQTIAAPQPIAAAPQIIANLRMKNFSLPPGARSAKFLLKSLRQVQRKVPILRVNGRATPPPRAEIVAPANRLGAPADRSSSVGWWNGCAAGVLARTSRSPRKA
jgi:hypothetical protein